VSIPIFNAWIDHGSGPKDAGYEYVVLPGVTLHDAKRFAASPGIRVLSNTAEVQAAYSAKEKMVEAVFRRPGDLRTPIGNVQVDHACALLIQHLRRGWKVTAADPAHGIFDLSVSVDSRKTVLHLPQGAFAGSSVTALLRPSS
jgi:chondroitin AC lyase